MGYYANKGLVIVQIETSGGRIESSNSRGDTGRPQAVSSVQKGAESESSLCKQVLEGMPPCFITTCRTALAVMVHN